MVDLVVVSGSFTSMRFLRLRQRSNVTGASANQLAANVGRDVQAPSISLCNSTSRARCCRNVGHVLAWLGMEPIAIFNLLRQMHLWSQLQGTLS